MDIILEIKKFVEEECRKPTSKYGYELFPFHFVPMVNYASQLADELGRDKEVILLAAWLHDIGSIVCGREDHHINGAKIAEEKLKALGYPSEKIQLVKACILNHRGSQKKRTETLEEQIIVEADVMSNFEDIGGLFQVALMFEAKGRGEAQKSVLNKLQNKWNQLRFTKPKKIIKPKFEAAMLLFR